MGRQIYKPFEQWLEMGGQQGMMMGGVLWELYGEKVPEKVILMWTQVFNLKEGWGARGWSRMGAERVCQGKRKCKSRIRELGTAWLFQRTKGVCHHGATTHGVGDFEVGKRKRDRGKVIPLWTPTEGLSRAILLDAVCSLCYHGLHLGYLLAGCVSSILSSGSQSHVV